MGGIHLKAHLTHISYTLPNGRLTNEVLIERFGKDVMDKIARMTGITERRVCAVDECASDLAVKAAESLFVSGACDRNEISLLIFATQTPDYVMPTTACILQERLGLPKSCAAFDINLGCSQYPYLLAIAQSWIDSGLCSKALLLTGDTPSKLINPLDKSAVTLFSDAASASVLEASELGDTMDFDFGTDGSGYDVLIVPASAFRNPPASKDYAVRGDENHNFRSNADMYIDGLRIFSFAYKIVPASVLGLLKRNNISITDIDLFVFHQAGEMMVSSIAKKLAIPSGKIYCNVREYGNCGGSSLPIALANAVESGRLKPGMKVVASAFGVGLSWGSVLLTWSDKFYSAVGS